MAVNIANVEAAIVEELKISPEEARVFVTIVKGGKMDADHIANALGCSTQRAQEIATALVDMGMIIEISNTEFESLHPRFAITNRYRRRCVEDGMVFKKNLRVDNIGIVLEKPYDDARGNISSS